MKRFLLVLGFFTLLLQPSWAAKTLQKELSPNAEISLLTCTPGQDLYTLFGHSALRVKDPVTGFDVAFNWGTFSFGNSQLLFGLKFIRGKLRYALSVNDFSYFMEDYRRNGRGVTEQKILLSQAERDALYEAMLINYSGDNRYYVYDFYFDNCATRIRDLLEEHVTEVTYAEASAYAMNKTFRDYLDEYVNEHIWIDLGFDLILGPSSYEHCSPRESMFLPDYLSLELGQATKGGQPLLGPSKGLLPRLHPAPENKPFYQRPPLYVWLGFILFVFLLAWEYRRQKQLPWISGTIYLVLGLLGILFLFMWLFTDHYSTWRNLNMLWAIPFGFLLIPLSVRYLGPKMYFVFLGLALIPVVGWASLPQTLNAAFFPLIGMLCTRYLSDFLLTKRK